MRFEQDLETRSVEHLTPGVMRLHQAIAVEEEALSRCHGDFMFLVPAPRHHPQRHACSPEFRDAIALTSIRQVLPRIGVAQSPTFGVKKNEEAGDKHPGWNLGREKIIDPR